MGLIPRVTRTYMESSAASQLERRPKSTSPSESERKEYVVQTPGRRLSARKPEEPSVVIQTPEVEELRQRIARGIGAFDARSKTERSHAEKILNEFRTKLDSGTMTEKEMDRFGEWMIQSRDELERLQGMVHDVPAGIPTGEIANENFRMIEKLEDAIHASKMRPWEAQRGMRYGQVREYELEQERRGLDAGAYAEEISKKIATEYGAEPEDLINGRGPLGKRLKFTFKNWLSRITGQETDFDRWQKAKLEEQSGELARLERLPEDRKTGRVKPLTSTTEATPPKKSMNQEDWVAELNDDNPAIEVKEEWLEPDEAAPTITIDDPRKAEEAPKKRTSRKLPKPSAELGSLPPEQRLLPTMTIELAQKTLPNAHGLWEFAKEAYGKLPEDKQRDLTLADLTRDPVTRFTLLMASYLQAKEAGNVAKADEAHKQTLALAEALGIEQSPYVLNIISQRKGEIRDRGQVTRTVKQYARTQQSRFNPNPRAY